MKSPKGAPTLRRSGEELEKYATELECRVEELTSPDGTLQQKCHSLLRSYRVLNHSRAASSLHLVVGVVSTPRDEQDAESGTTQRTMMMLA